MATGRKRASRSISEPWPTLLARNSLLRGGPPGKVPLRDMNGFPVLESVMSLAPRLAFVIALSLALAAPALADGRKGPSLAAPKIPPLRTLPAPAPLPPPVQLELPAPVTTISLPNDFGTGGVGADVGGGYGGSTRVIVMSNARSQASAHAVAFAYASASARSGSFGGGRSGGGCGCR